MAATQQFLRRSLFCLFIFLFLSHMGSSLTESEALLKLKSSFTKASALNSWVNGSLPCEGEVGWDGLVCSNGIVTDIRLGGFGLSGKIDVDALLELSDLRSISIMSNNFSGSIPAFNRLGSLRAIYLSRNRFSGEIPSDYFANMGSLKKVYLSSNMFTGKIPSSLAQIPRLGELLLDNNQFSGTIPSIDQPTLASLDVANNKLEGEIPSSLTKFNASTFKGNGDLCGEPLGNECKEAAAGPAGSKNTSISKNMIIAIVVAAVVLLMIIVVIIVRSRRKKRDEFDVLEHEKRNSEEHVVEVRVSQSGSSRKEADSIHRKGSSSSRRGSNKGKGNMAVDLVVVNNEKGVFGLSDLMRASAEVLGNGSSGSAYKAVMANGVAVVVKRMREMNALGRDQFDAEIRQIASLQHWNILTPLAYHFRKDEKLLVYEYIPKGSLLYLLHGDRGPSHAELNWPTRLKIVQGIAQGMGYIHTELAYSSIPHGNLKSSNILLTPDFDPLLIDYGFFPLINPLDAAQALFAFKAPEAAIFGLISPKCDVYSLGIVILEILTGKYPSQYLNSNKGGTDVVEWVNSAIADHRQSELFDPEIASSRNSIGEMKKLLHIGAACTESDPEQRLDMMEAIRRIEEVQVEGDQEDRTMYVTPSLRDSYEDSFPQITFEARNSYDGLGGLSRTRHESHSFASQSSGRPSTDDNFVFAIP
ncbi:pollen receptor-like kinase 3 [Quercus robur]|uniref:pollen receptor-like kinase 3 n=1 Tax=Quercus robur TaxID=38942 RepID=UPI002163D22B|nr:pollen receptor-like kinase 3 [Quercus robur]